MTRKELKELLVSSPDIIPAFVPRLIGDVERLHTELDDAAELIEILLNRFCSPGDTAYDQLSEVHATLEATKE